LTAIKALPPVSGVARRISAKGSLVTVGVGVAVGGTWVGVGVGVSSRNEWTTLGFETAIRIRNKIARNQNIFET
jgi:hypothetical protein